MISTIVIMRLLLCTTVYFITTTTLAFTPSTIIDSPWMDSTLSIHTRVELLVSVMTQKEKVSQLLSTHLYKEDTTEFLNKYDTIGFGVILPCPRVRTGKSPSAAQCMQWRNDIQTHFSTKTRLRIPISFREELLHSAGIPGSTIFPMPANLGATWNQSLVTAVYKMVGREARAAGMV